MNHWYGMLASLVGLLVGAVVTWACAKHYYVQAAQDLQEAARQLARQNADLQNLSTLSLRALEEAGLVEFNKDERGKPIGLVIRLSGTIEATSSVSTKAQVITKEETDSDND